MVAEPRTPCRTPAKDRDGVTNIPTWKFDLLRGHILDIVGAAGPDGFPMAELSAAIAPRLTDDETARLGKLGWHMMAVKLEMEVAGDLARMPKVTPQRLVLPASA
ncbi:DUF6958 family protein [Flavimaricola marinus]|uniref:Uncharacterized protein n=1 Tax=Flavimaricola marinus TaxID=1819565 RepID=A0A238LHZ1_9RHOB|nr:hypothetical protein [Flavimaricola marinus]SMY09024.1 hypothetical protein LOM8899_03185 [Flavimaricola marinus]